MTRHSVLVIFWILYGLHAANAQVKSSFVIGEDGMTRQLDFPIEGGNVYTLEASEDLQSWTSENSWLSLAGIQPIRYPLFRFPAPLDSTITPPRAISFTLQKLTPAGSFICWKSLDDGTMKRQALPSVTPNVKWLTSPFHTRQAGSYLFSATYLGTLPITPRNAALGPQDSAMLSTLGSAIATMNLDKNNNIEPIASPPIRTQAHKYWRLNRTSAATLDSDSDGLKNNVEYALGTNPISSDSDLDGLIDGLEALVSRDPLINEAVTNPDGAGFPLALRPNLTAYWDFESQTIRNNIITYPDVGNNAYPLTARAGMVTSNQGMLNKAANFTGLHSLRTSPAVLAGRSSFSISFWFKAQLGSIQQRAGNINTFFFAFNDNDTDVITEFHLRAYKSTGGGQKLIISQFGIDQVFTLPILNPLDDGKWQHLALTKFSTIFTIYRNGSSIGSVGMNSNSLSTTALGYFCIGNVHPLAQINTPFRGQIDRFCIHFRAISPLNINALIQQNADGDSLTDYEELLSGVTSPYVFDP